MRKPLQARPARADAPEVERAEMSAAERAAAASLALYIADMSAELAMMAQRSDLTMLAYFLRLARVEAPATPTVDDAGRA
jgi:hypothetical protein